jgi:hypothetical protein
MIRGGIRVLTHHWTNIGMYVELGRRLDSPPEDSAVDPGGEPDELRQAVHGSLEEQQN